MTWTQDRARFAALRRYRDADDPALLDARQALRVTRAEDYLRRLVDAAPALTSEQCRRLAAILLRS